MTLKIKISSNKTKMITVIALALLMASTAIMSIPVKTVQAQATNTIYQVYSTPSTVSGYPTLGPLPTGVTPDYSLYSRAYLSISPNPIGVNQLLLINVWCEPGVYHAFYMSQYKVTVQKPDGTTFIIGPFNSYLADSTAWIQLVPDEAGTWQFQFSQPGTFVPAGTYVDHPGTAGSANYVLAHSIYYEPSSTAWQNLTVQQTMVTSWPPAALPGPGDYWTRPANPMNREWTPILGNYPWTGTYTYPDGARTLYSSNYKYTAYVTAPTSCHVLWRRQVAINGLIGGAQINQQYSLTPLGVGTSPIGGTPSIIYDGRCYQTITKAMPTVVNGSTIYQPMSVWECYDLQTGQVYWDLTGVTAPPTNILYETPPAGSAASATTTVYLVAISGGRLLKYDPYTGAVNLNISLPTNIQTGTMGFSGQLTMQSTMSGTIYNNEWVLTVQIINVATNNYRLINWTMRGSSTNFATRIASNITWPSGDQIMAGQAGIYYGTFADFDAGIATCLEFNTQFLSSMNPSAYGLLDWCIGYTMWSIDLNTGALLFNQSSMDTINNQLGPPGLLVNRGKIAFPCEGMHWSCFDARTGRQLWQSENMTYPWGFGFPYTQASYDINESKSEIITSTYEGLYAIDWDTGKILWHYVDSNAVPFEDPYGATPFFSVPIIADGRIYVYNAIHNLQEPIARDWKTFCINATTGELIWEVLNPMVPGAVADGYLAAANADDGYMYVFGIGQSKTTVEAPLNAVTQDSPVLIQGTVMDMSPGDQGSTTNPTARLDSTTKPSTVPCVNDASMETQMEYLYEQQPVDGMYHNETLTGVPVALTATDSNGTVYSIGTTTSNGYSGSYGISWTPPNPGIYYISATYAGDDSYGSSSAVTQLLVTAPPATSPAPTSTPTSSTLTLAQVNSSIVEYVAILGIILVLAIAIVGVLILRKK